MPTPTTTTGIAAAAAVAGALAGAAFGQPPSPAHLPPPISAITFDADGGPLPPPRSDVRLDHELCNGLDDDWDGKADETFPILGLPCDGSDLDSARCGVFVCRADGKAVECRETEIPRAEWCNEKDDDCDGQTDEECVAPPDAGGGQ